MYDKFYVRKKNLRARNCRRKFTSWKTQRKHVNQTTAIYIAIETFEFFRRMTLTNIKFCNCSFNWVKLAINYTNFVFNLSSMFNGYAFQFLK